MRIRKKVNVNVNVVLVAWPDIDLDLERAQEAVEMVVDCVEYSNSRSMIYKILKVRLTSKNYC